MDAVTNVPFPGNEPIKGYAPGSPERATLEQKIKDLAGDRAELTMTIGGRQVLGGGETIDIVQPHNHRHVLGQLRNSTDADVLAAIEAARAAAPGWRALSFDDRAAIFIKAADLLAGPWRSVINGSTILGQSKSVFQAEIDAACELIDFWKYNDAFCAGGCWRSSRRTARARGTGWSTGRLRGSSWRSRRSTSPRSRRTCRPPRP